jgi:hypothetical protein|tara:strand:- start:1323 stop:1718 length:396 start_codon:yes stop_codon:yes gene_type:complete
MKRVKTAMGQTLDMSALAAKHEKVRAVSNLNMNARGDIIDNRNKVTIPREEIANKFNDNVVTGVTEQVSIQTPESKKDSAPVETPPSAKKNVKAEVTEVSRTARTRDNGEQYFEVEYSDGTMEDINQKGAE